jgi:hypothetical protein
VTSGVVQGIVEKKEESLVEKEIDDGTAIPSAGGGDCCRIGKAIAY